MSDPSASNDEIIEIQELPEDLTTALHQRASENGKTLEQEVRSILEDHLGQNTAEID